MYFSIDSRGIEYRSYEKCRDDYTQSKIKKNMPKIYSLMATSASHYGLRVVLVGSRRHGTTNQNGDIVVPVDPNQKNSNVQEPMKWLPLLTRSYP